MKELSFDAVVVGGGAAGMAAALEIDAAGFSCALVDREEYLGGVLLQCVHNGFGLHEFKEELTGPEFAERFAEKIRASGVSTFLGTTAVSLDAPEGAGKELVCASPEHGMMRISCRSVVLAMGCRERNRGNVRIPGARPSGVYTAGLAQRLVNIEGYIPGKNVVVIGSGDIGLIMARRMSWAGCSVKAVVEIMPYPSGLTRNIVQCLNDFGIPLHLSCQTTNIFGKDRVEGVEVTPMENGALIPEKAFRIDCDTVLLSVGLVPENELSKEAGIELNAMTNGPSVDSTMMTSADGVFACGNVLHVHDLVDWAAEEARRTGRAAADWLRGERVGQQYRIKAGSNVRYVNPGRIDPKKANTVYLRSLVVKNDAVLQLKANGVPIKTVKKSHVQPSEMITLPVGGADLGDLPADAVLEISLT